MNLQSYSNFLRENLLRELAEENLHQSLAMDIPLVKLMMKSLSHLSHEQLVEMTMKSTGEFLLSLENGTTIERAKANLKLWEEDKLPGIKKEDIHPSDIILLYAAQKRALLKFLPDFTNDVNQAIGIMAELEGFHTLIQNDGIQLLFKIQQQTDTTLKERENQLQTIFDNAPDAIIATGLDLSVTEWNKAAEKIYGYTREEIIGKPATEFIHSMLPTPAAREEARVQIKSTGVWGGELTQSTQRRKDMTILCSSSLLKNVEGEPIGYLGINRDVTDMKKMEKELHESEMRYQLLVNEVVDYSIITLDPQGTILTWNKGAEKIKGYKEEEIIGKHFSVFYSEKDKANGIPGLLLNEALKQGKVSYAAWRVKKDGTLFWADVVLTELVDEKKNSKGFVKITRDLSERRKTEEQLREMEERFNRAFHSSPAGITLIGLSTGKYIDTNESFLSMIGYTREEVIGHTSLEIAIVDAEVRAAMLKEIASAGSLKNKEFIYRKKSGATGNALFSTEIIVVNNEQCLLSILYDISDRKQTELNLESKTTELMRSNADLEQFAYVASHDLQEPLRMVTSYVQLLENRYKDKLDQDAVDFINYAVDGATRMQILIYSLLEYSRVNNTSPFKQVNMDTVLSESLNGLQIALQESRAKINRGPLPVVEGDSVLLGQLIFNLIANAIKFKSEKPLEVSIEAKKLKDKYLFSVRDNGIGIQAEYLEKIFVIFQRLHTKDRYTGTGIGLAICKKIVEKHEGKIWVESEINKGSTFYFTIKSGLKKSD